jgi:hypothetical protein
MQDYRDNSSANSEISRHLMRLFEQGKPSLQHGFQFLYFLLSNTDTIPQPKGYPSKSTEEEDSTSFNNTRCGHLLNVLSETPAFRALFPDIDLDEEEPDSTSADETEHTPALPSKAKDTGAEQNRLFRKLKLRHAKAIKNPFFTEDKQPRIPPILFAAKTQDKSIAEFFHPVENSGIYPPFHNHPEMLIPFITLHALLHEMQTIVLTCEETLILDGISEEILTNPKCQRQINWLMTNFKNVCEALKNCQNNIATHTEAVRGDLFRTHGVNPLLKGKSWTKNFAQLLRHRNDFTEALTECASYCDSIIAHLGALSSTQQAKSTTEAINVFIMICTKQNEHIVSFLKQLPDSLSHNIILTPAFETIADDHCKTPSEPPAESKVSPRSSPPTKRLGKIDSKIIVIVKPNSAKIPQSLRDKHRTNGKGHPDSPTGPAQTEVPTEQSKLSPSPQAFFGAADTADVEFAKSLQLHRQPSFHSPASPKPASEAAQSIAVQPIRAEDPAEKIIDLHGIHVTTKDKTYRVLTDDSVTIIKDYLQQKPKATTVLLMKNNIGPMGAKRLCTILATHPLLEELNISDNPLLTTEIKKSQEIAENIPVGWIGAKALANLLKANKCIKNLLLGNTGLIDQSLAIFSGGLAECTALEIFDISNNAITDMGFASICDYLQQIPTLCQVIITNNKLTDVCGNRLLRLLEEKPQIIILDIRDNEFSVEMLERINAELKINQDGRPPAPTSPTLN